MCYFLTFMTQYKLKISIELRAGFGNEINLWKVVARNAVDSLSCNARRSFFKWVLLFCLFSSTIVLCEYLLSLNNISLILQVPNINQFRVIIDQQFLEACEKMLTWNPACYILYLMDERHYIICSWIWMWTTSMLWSRDIRSIKQTSQLYRMFCKRILRRWSFAGV